MKKTFTIFVLLLFYSNSIAQGCDDYFTFNASATMTSSGATSGTVSLYDAYIVEAGTPYSTSFNSNSIPNTIRVKIIVRFSCCGFAAKTISFNTSGCTPGNHYTSTQDIDFWAVSGQDDGDATVRLSCTWRCRPLNVTSIDIPSGFNINDGDEISMQASPFYQDYEYAWLSEGNILFPADQSYTSHQKEVALSIGNNSLISNAVYVRSHIGQDESCNSYSTELHIYPRRPVITDVSTTPPGCNGDNDGKISITIDGALSDNNTEEGSVKAYKATVARLESFGFSEPGDTTNQEFNVLTWVDKVAVRGEGRASNSLITTSEKTFTGSMFEEGLIAGDYVILLENIYRNADSTSYANGHTFTVVTIPEKDVLRASVSATGEKCNESSDGHIRISIKGGNPYYDAYLYDLTGNLIDSRTNVGSYTLNYQPENLEFKPVALCGFNNLSAGEYNIQLKDENNCNVTVSGYDTDGYIIDGINITQPEPLECNFNNKTDVLCNGENSGELTYNISGGTIGPGYEYSLTKSGTTVSEGQTSGELTIPDLAAGTYTLNVTDTKSCVVSYSKNPVTITEPTELTISSLTIDRSHGYAIDCYGNSTGSVAITPKGGAGNYEYTSDDNSYNTNSTITGLNAGEHTFYLKDGNGCIISTKRTLNEPGQLKIDTLKLNHYFGGNNIKCDGGTDTVFVTAQGGVTTEDYNYFVDNVEVGTSTTISNINSGTHNIKVKDANDCKNEISVELKAPDTDPEIASVDAVSYKGFGVSCYGGSNGQLTVRPENGKGTVVDGNYYTFSVDSVGAQEAFQSDSVYSQLSAGTYSFRIKDANGCSSGSFSVDIEQPDSVSFSVSKKTYGNGSFNIKCNGDSSGYFSMFPSGGIEGLAYTYFVNDENINNDTIFNLPAGSYTACVKDANNCVSRTQTVSLNEPDKISFTIDTNKYLGNHAIRCYGMTDSVKIKAFGGYAPSNYQAYLNKIRKAINPGDSTYFSVTADTIYDIIIQDQNNCTIDSANEFTLTQPDEMQMLYMDSVPSLCKNSTDGKINARWSGGTHSYSNSYDYFVIQESDTIQNIDGVGVNDTVSFYNLVPEEEYEVFVRDNNLCLDSGSIFITAPPILEANTAEEIPPPCHGDSEGGFLLSGKGGTHTNNLYDFYIITSYGDSLYISEADTAFFENVGLGSHQYFVVDEHDCTSSPEDFSIVEPEELLLSTESGRVSVQGGSDGRAAAKVQGGTVASGSDYRYKWRDAFGNILDGETDKFINGYPAGEYSVEVWDDNDCPYGNSNTGLLQNVTINEPGQAFELFVVKLRHTSVPGNNDGSVTLEAAGGWGNYLYKKEGGSAYTASPLFSGLAPGNYRFYAKDNSNTEIWLDTVIQEAEVLEIKAVPADVKCFMQHNGTVSIIASGGTMPYLYSLDNTNFTTSPEFSDLSPGNYTAYVTDENGIEASVDFSVSEPDELTVGISDVQNTSCGAGDGSLTANAYGGTVPYSYNWYLGEEHIGQYEAKAENLQAGLYTVEVNDANFCTAKVQKTVYNSNGPEIDNIITTDASCHNTADGTAAILGVSASGNYTVVWSTGQSNLMTTENLEPGNYSVTVKDENDCSVTEAFEIKAPDDLSFNFVINKPTCHNACNGSIHAEISGGSAPYDLEWPGIDGNPTTNVIDNLCAGQYSLKVSDANACNYMGVATVENPEQITIFEENEATICQGQSITLDAGNPGSSYQWTTDAGSLSNEQTATVNEEGTYYVTLVTPLGCSASDMFELNFSDSFLQANFLMQSEAEVGDTVVLVEVSWEQPDSVLWEIPEALWLLSENEQNIQVVPTQAGVYTVGLNAYLGTCNDYFENDITISATGDKSVVMPRYIKNDEKKFKSLNLYPNPNNGIFNLDIRLYEEDNITIEIYDLLGQRQQEHKVGKAEKQYSFDFNISQLKKGMYFVLIRTNTGTAGIKFVKE